MDLFLRVCKEISGAIYMEELRKKNWGIIVDEGRAKERCKSFG